MGCVRALVLLLIVVLPTACGYALQVSSVESSFQGRFGCPNPTITGVRDGWHVEGCGRTAEYACIPEAGSVRAPVRDVGDVLARTVVDTLFAGTDERCVLTSSEQTPLLAPVASDAPAHVQRLSLMTGGAVIKTRTLFGAGYLAALARPSLHPEHALLIVHTTARLPPEPCAAELRHDGVAMEVVQQARRGDYEQHLVVTPAALEALARASSVHGSVCGIAIELDASGRSTLGLFAAQLGDERSKLEARSAGGPGDSRIPPIGAKPGWRHER